MSLDEKNKRKSQRKRKRSVMIDIDENVSLDVVKEDNKEIDIFSDSISDILDI